MNERGLIYNPAESGGIRRKKVCADESECGKKAEDGEKMISGNPVKNEMINDFGIKMPRVLISGTYAVVDSVKKIYVLSEDIVTLETPEGYISILGSGICVDTLCDERIELSGDISGVEFVRPQVPGKKGKNADGTKNTAGISSSGKGKMK